MAALRSDLLAIVRGAHLADPANLLDVVDPGRMARLLDPPAPEACMEEFCAVTGFGTEAEQDLHWTELLCWELGRRSGPEPYNCRAVLELLLARPLVERVGGTLLYALIDRLWPDLLDIPILTPAGGVTRLSTARHEAEALVAAVARRGQELVELEGEAQAQAKRVIRLERGLPRAVWDANGAGQGP
jgi:hypothetical protein